MSEEVSLDLFMMFSGLQISPKRMFQSKDVVEKNAPQKRRSEKRVRQQETTVCTYVNV